MKKVFPLIMSVFLVLFLSGCIVDDISLFYSDVAEKDNLFIAINKTANCCFAGGYDCVEYTENMKITIPDEYDGKPITKIGGYYGRGVPTPFSVSLADIYMNAEEGSEYDAVFNGDITEYGISEEYTVKDVVFVLNIGKNISSIDYVVMNEYYPHINEDNSITFYHPVVEINCSEENNYFYSKNGKLYNKKNDELIEDFAYRQ